MRQRKKRFGLTLVLAAVIGLSAIPVAVADPPVSDMSISWAVEDELLLDPGVSSYRIDVYTNDGIVTLSGSVGNLLAKERAARVARIVKGVRAVVNRVEVHPSALRMDQQILEDVREALLNDPATDSYEVAVAVQDNVVTLSGTVQSWQEYDLCATVAKGVQGVTEVRNKLAVVWPEKRPDLEIAAEVRQALKWDAFLDHALIDVKVHDAKVILSGTVGSAAEKTWAVTDALVHGVKSVDDSALEVKRWARDKDLKGEKYARKSEKEIKNAVTDALVYDPRVSSFDVTAEVAGNTVTLRGTVDNLKAKRAAAQDARNTVGVRTVDNRIHVRPTELLTDRKIEDKVRQAFLRDPYVESYEITVDVRNGVADLYGTVDTYFEKSQADDVASRVSGVIMVDNNLNVRRDFDPYTYDPYLDDWSYEYRWNYRPRFSAKSDAQIREDIRHELFWSPYVDADDVTVAVNEGVVTLTGTVDSWSEYNAAANNAYDGGAVYVDNDLIVDAS